jgi:hypothetical protein
MIELVSLVHSALLFHDSIASVLFVVNLENDVTLHISFVHCTLILPLHVLRYITGVDPQNGHGLRLSIVVIVGFISLPSFDWWYAEK